MRTRGGPHSLPWEAHSPRSRSSSRSSRPASSCPTGPFATALLVPAVLATVLALINLLPVAPMDGWLLLRSAEWARHGSRAEAERRALQWSRCLLVYAMLAASLIVFTDRIAGMIATMVCACFVIQHHKLVTRLAEQSSDGR